VAVVIHFYASSRLVSSLTDSISGPGDKALTEYASKVRNSFGAGGAGDSKKQTEDDLQSSLSKYQTNTSSQETSNSKSAANDRPEPEPLSEQITKTKENENENENEKEQTLEDSPKMNSETV